MNNVFAFIVISMVACTAVGMPLRENPPDSQILYRDELLQSLRPACNRAGGDVLVERFHQMYGIEKDQYRKDLLSIVWDATYTAQTRVLAALDYSRISSDEEIASQFLYVTDTNNEFRASCTFVPLSHFSKFDNLLDYSRKTLWFQTTNDVARFDQLPFASFWRGRIRGKRISDDERRQVLEMYQELLMAPSIATVLSSDLVLVDADPAYAKSELRKTTILRWMPFTNSVPENMQPYFSKYFLKAYQAFKDIQDVPCSIPTETFPKKLAEQPDP